MRPSMQLKAVSTPAAIWLCLGPTVMLSMKLRSFSRSAKARLSLKLPLAANLPEPGVVLMDSAHAQACLPRICTGPEYGRVADPSPPNIESPALMEPPPPNWVEVKEKWIP